MKCFQVTRYIKLGYTSDISRPSVPPSLLLVVETQCISETQDVCSKLKWTFDHEHHITSGYQQSFKSYMNH